MARSILTIGYGNRSLDGVINLLRNESVQYLLDVRSNPQSKFNPDFSSEHLGGALRDAGIRYVFVGDTLGGRPSDVSCYSDGHVVYDRVREKDFFQVGISRLLNAVSQDLRICLLCSEARPEHCHRSKLIGVALCALGVEVLHFGPNGERQSQTEVLKRLESLQGDLFGLSLRSRRAYNPSTKAAGRKATAGPSKR
jgi:uncharacterized protein (DUF488 family)